MKVEHYSDFLKLILKSNSFNSKSFNSLSIFTHWRNRRIFSCLNKFDLNPMLLLAKFKEKLRRTSTDSEFLIKILSINFLFSIIFYLASCTSTHCRLKEIESLQSKQDPKPKTVKVYRYDGTLQCGMGKRIPLEEQQAELKSLKVISTAHLNDGLMRVQLCGSPTGDANVFEIAEEDLEKAKSFSFREWTFGGNNR